MKLSYTIEEIESWRDKVHRRRPRLAVKTKKEALDFINSVGFCFAFKADNSELPCLWHAACGAREPVMPEHTHHDPYLSFVWEMKDILPSEGKIYYGKLLRKRPTMISLEYLPYFYVLSGRSGARDEFMKEFLRGELTSTAKEIMEALTDSSPQLTKGLKLATGSISKRDRAGFDKAITELQTKMFLVKVAEAHDPFSFVWAPLRGAFAAQVKKAKSISPEVARFRILERYFQNQLVGTVDSVHRLFRWSKQTIYHTLGQLVERGIVTTSIKVDGRDHKYYCLLIGR